MTSVSMPMSPPFSLIPTDQIAPQALHTAFVRAFSDYVAGPIALAPEQWHGFLLRQGVDLALGRAAVDVARGAVRAFALVAPRPRISRWRLATMGAVPESRGSGAAAALLEDFVQRGQAGGLRAVELEVFSQNERAVRLYRRHGFAERHALQGWQRQNEPADSVPAPPEHARTPQHALAWLREAELSIPDLPLQVGASIVATLAVTWQAWQHGRAQLVFSGDREAGLVVRSLIDHDPAQRDAEALVRAMVAAWPGTRIHVPALQRPDLGGDALQRCGFERETLSQWIMRRDLAGECA